MMQQGAIEQELRRMFLTFPGQRGNGPAACRAAGGTTFFTSVPLALCWRCGPPLPGANRRSDDADRKTNRAVPDAAGRPVDLCAGGAADRENCPALG
jgi:hypothetical protein